MSKLEELIKKYCPDGVEYVKLGDVCEIKTGKGITQKDCFEDAEYPVISGGSEYMGFYNQYNREAHTVTVSRVGNCGYVNYLDRRFYLNDKCFSVIPFVRDINPKYLYYFLKFKELNIKQLQSEGGVPTINTHKLATIEIPIFQKEIQEEIVRILDSYTEKYNELQSSLNAELQLRKDEYEYYSNKLLDNTKGMVRMCLGDLYDFKNGLNKGKEFFGKGSVIVNFTDVYKNKFLKGDILKGRVEVTSKELKLYSVHRGDVFFTRTSETQEDIGVASVMLDDINECVFSGFVLRARPKTDLLLNKYIAYCLSSHSVRKDIVKYSTFTTRALTSGSKLSKIVISIPSLSEQQRIVTLLDRYTEAYTELVKNIELEIKARQEEYEYYRDKLLTFKRKAV